MNSPLLKLPIDYELRPDVRKLALRLRDTHGDDAVSWAALFFVRLWCDWARAAMDWRSLDTPYRGVEHDWSRESLTHIIEEFCGWKKGAGGLIKICLEVGVLQLIQRGDLFGLTLTDFWRHNEHLSPDFKSIQQRGGHAKAARRALGQIDEMAGQQVRLLQDELIFSHDITPEERRKAVALIMRMDRACGHSVRSSSQYEQGTVDSAVRVIRKYSPENIAMVESYLMKNRENPEVVKVPDRVIADFETYFRRAE